jgi:elongation factor G
MVLEIAIEPTAFVDEALLRLEVDRILAVDPLAVVTFDDESDQLIIHMRDERYLDFLSETLRRKFADSIKIGAPQVAYREYLTKPVDIDYTHKKQSGGSGQFARVKFKVTPGERGAGINFNDNVKGGNIPKEYIPSVEKGMRETAASGSLVGFPIIDFDVELYDGAYHDADSSALAFEIAGRAAMREAAQKSDIKLLEPIMKVAVITRERWLAPIRSNLIGRHATITEELNNGGCVVIATAPMVTLFGLEKDLQDLSDGDAAVAMLWECYAPVPPHLIGPDDTFPSAAALRA